MTLPLIYQGWEPVPQGIRIMFSVRDIPSALTHYDLDMVDVRELAADMEEANQMARGNVKLDVMASEVLPLDKMYLFNNVVMVSDVLKQHPNDIVLQFGDSYSEVTLPFDQQVTVYRAVE